MNVTLFGLGYVGSVTATCLAVRGHRVVGVDTDAGKVATINAGHPPVVEPGLDELAAQAVAAGALRATEAGADALADSDLSLVCVGTPSARDGSTDLTFVRRVVEEIGQSLAGHDRPHTVVIRSTVPPGTVEDVVAPLLEEASGRPIGPDLQVAMCPEFLREGSSVRDFFDPPLLVIGITDRAPGAAEPLKELFGFLDCEVRVVSSRAAESVKYASNAFHALKVAFTNEVARLCRVLSVDSREVMDVFVQDRQLNVSSAYLRPGFAFGGSCLPKDVRSLLHLGRMNAIDLPVLAGTMASNELVVRDVADRVLRAVDGTGRGNRRVAMLGLSFKHLTDDLRESPNVALAEILIGKGLDVSIHDPIVNMAKLSGANLRYVHAKLPHLQRVLYDDPAAALAGAHVAIVSSAGPAVIDAIIAANPPVVLDLSGRLPQLEALPGYEGVGW
ncbi:GDP-mannose 6-dehydrogenase [Pseudonocardia thermophila]|uniref:UDP-glucose 6-dehydrogenase n=1 Tax=Pseudonocardia thermophila TaxID=1848 RepID=A0A1M6YV43_PSETH|nr:nucleotide sugar dehydrogenase [Pseudonocardia thermophila]SHL22136.1 GDP-mannose 6-dehydrogenase [Pseudonocardia thermophila]